MSEIHGDGEKVITSKTYADALEEKAQGVINYTFPGNLEDAVSDAPALGTRTDFYPGLILQKRQFSEGEGCTDVTLTYYKTEPESTDDKTNEPSYQLTSTDGTRSILLHPRYESVSKEVKTVAKYLLNGGNPWEKVYYARDGETLKIENESFAGATETTVEKLADKAAAESDLALELLKKIASGISLYEVNGADWTETVYKKSLTGAMKQLGKRSNPPGPNPGIDGDWRLVSVQATKTKSDKLWKIDKKWKSSDPGATWDKELY